MWSCARRSALADDAGVPAEGHGFRAPANRKALAVAMEKFLSKQLGGRYQEDVRPETQEKLDAITVGGTQA